MANATARIATTAQIDSSTPRCTYGASSTAQTFYPNEFVALNSSGYLVKADDTAAVLFAGLVDSAVAIEVPSGGSNGDVTITVARPPEFDAYIASAAITDVGKHVFCLYSNELSFAPGLSYFTYAGRVVRYVNATTVRVRAHYLQPAPVVKVTMPYTAASTDISHFVADKAYRVKAITHRVDVAGTDAGAVTGQPVKAASGTAIGSGTALSTAASNLKSTAATNTSVTVHGTSANLDIAAGTCIGLDFTGTMTAAVGSFQIDLVPVS